MGKNRNQQGHAAETNPQYREREVTLSAIEAELVKVAIAENTDAIGRANAQLASRLAPIRAGHKVAQGVRADFRQRADSIVMVALEPVPGT